MFIRKTSKLEIMHFSHKIYINYTFNLFNYCIIIIERFPLYNKIYKEKGNDAKYQLYNIFYVCICKHNKVQWLVFNYEMFAIKY